MKNTVYDLPVLPNTHECKIESHFNGVVTEEVPPDRNVKTYIVCFTNRCGSNYFSSALSSDERFGLADELFNANSIIDRSNQLGLKSLEQYTALRIKQFEAQEKVFGVKLGASQLLYLTKKQIIPDFLRPPVFVRVKRENTVAQAVSYMIAIQTDKWNSDQLGNSKEPKYDSTLIADCLKGIHQSNAVFDYYFALHQVEPIEIVYEKIVDQFASAVDILSSHLDIKHPVASLERTRTRMQRNNINYQFERRFRQDCQMNI